MPTLDEDEDREGDEVVDAPPENDREQRLVRLPARRRRRKPDPTEPPAAVAATVPVPAPMPAAPRVPAPLPAPPPEPPPPTVSMNHAPAPTESNILFCFEEAVKLNPTAAESIFLTRKSGTPAQWMVTTRPRTASQLFAAIKALHGRSGEATYEVSFRDSAGRGSNGTVSMHSTLEELPAPVAAHPYAAPPPPYSPPPAYAQPVPQPFAPQPFAPQPYTQPAAVPPQPSAPGAPIDALLAMQKQTLDMVQALQAARQQPPAAAPPVHAPPPVAPAADPLAMLLAAQRQTIEMIQAMQPAAAPAAPLPPPVAPTAPAPPPADPLAMLLAAQRQTIEMIQAMQPGAPSVPVAAPAAPAPTAADPMSLMLAMQKQTLDMVMTVMQSAQRAAAPAAGPYRPPFARESNDPSDPRRPPYQGPARPQSPTEQLREAASVLRDFRRTAREFGFDGGAPAAVVDEDDEDDNPVRVIPMGPARGVINRDDGSLRVAETIMANLPDAVAWMAKQREAVQKERDLREQRERERQQAALPPGYVLAGPDYQPPPGYVAVPVDQIPPGAQPAQATSAPAQQSQAGVDLNRSAERPRADSLPEPPAEMPPPIDDRPQSSWGMPPARRLP